MCTKRLTSESETLTYHHKRYVTFPLHTCVYTLPKCRRLLRSSSIRRSKGAWSILYYSMCWYLWKDWYESAKFWRSPATGKRQWCCDNERCMQFSLQLLQTPCLVIKQVISILWDLLWTDLFLIYALLSYILTFFEISACILIFIINIEF